MRVVVYGSRHTKDRNMVWKRLDIIPRDNLTIICGYDPYSSQHQGIDQLAYEWAKARGVPVMPFPAPWRLGVRAGPMRNRRMVEDAMPERGIEFPGKVGTADMRGKLELARIPVDPVFE